MSVIKFDRLKLCVPAECVTITEIKESTTTISGDGFPIHAKYEQKQPFFYSILIDYKKRTTDIEFSGKALMEDYPSLIDHTNITTCIHNINSCGACYIDSDKALEECFVKQCDVTCDISSPVTITELYNSLNLSSSKSWCLRDITTNRFTVESTNTTKRFKSRLIIYDKEEEMTRKNNQDFLAAISNADEQIDYFKGKIRYELNLNSTNRIRYFFKIPDTKLSTLFSSSADPIATFISKITRDNDSLQPVAQMSGNIRELEHLLLLAICDYDLNKIELLIREMYGSNRSVKRCKEPYMNLLVKLKDIIPEPHRNTTCCDISSKLRYLLSRLNHPGTLSPNLRSLYEMSKDTSCSSADVDLFNINPPKQPTTL